MNQTLSFEKNSNSKFSQKRKLNDDFTFVANSTKRSKLKNDEIFEFRNIKSARKSRFNQNVMFIEDSTKQHRKNVEIFAHNTKFFNKKFIDKQLIDEFTESQNLMKHFRCDDIETFINNDLIKQSRCDDIETFMINECCMNCVKYYSLYSWISL